MTDARITNLPLQVLESADVDAQITNLPVQVLESADVDAQITNLGIYVIASPPCIPRLTELPIQVLEEATVQPHILNLPIQVLAYEIDCVSYLVQCWRIERLDGVVHTFTMHDRPIVFEGETYSPCGSINASAYQASGQFGDVGNASLIGLLSLDGIAAGVSIDDISAGLLDAAEVKIWEVAWQGDEKPLPILRGYIGKIVQKDISYEAEIITLSELLNNHSMLESYTPTCRFMLGDSRCTVNLAPFTESSTVSEIVDGHARSQSHKRQFIDIARIEADGYWANGVLTWTGGDNAGYSSEVANSFDSGAISLWNVMPNIIQVGDAYTIIAGCDKNLDTCKNKFNNVANFGGFPDIPGNDVIFKTPDAKE